MNDHSTTSDIAIIGRAVRVPGARTVSRFWQGITNNTVSITDIGDDQLTREGVAPSLLRDPNYVKRNGMIEDAECFDAAFFGIGPRDAAIMDPQHRHFLEAVWEALEDAARTPRDFGGAIGVYAGSGMNGYMLNNLVTNRRLLDSIGMFLLRHTANDKDFLSTGVSYRLDLKGPSINVQTACSTSLVAVHLASQALLNGECDMALAGGVTIQVPHSQGYLFREGEILSADGYCRPFERRSDGTVMTSGLGVVVLRRLADALADGDNIRAVIRASAVNNDGATKVSYLAPSVEGHAGVVAEALALAGLDPARVQYLEAHGTGTAIGDPIEVAALTQAYRLSTDKSGFCRLGSLKANIGHTDTAAGVLSLIKVAEAMGHQTLPPLTNFESPNPTLDLPGTPFYLSGEATPWISNGEPRLAGVSSLGVGGTNAHLIVEEAPAQSTPEPSQPWQLLLLSAKTEPALEQMTDDLAEHLKCEPSQELADIAYTLQVGRSRLPQARAIVVRGREDAPQVLATRGPDSVWSRRDSKEAPAVVFMFPGAGTQHPNMGRDLYESEPVFRQHADECFRLLESSFDFDFKTLIYPNEAEVAAAAEKLSQPSFSMPAIFLTEYALAQLWLSWGVEPAAMTGHSLGEYTAACLAGVFSLEDALRMVLKRSELMERAEEGAMLVVPLGESEVLNLLGDDLSLAVVNGPNLCVVSGAIEPIESLERELASRGVEGKRLRMNAALHSKLLEPFLEDFRESLASIEFHAPKRPFISNLTGTWVKAEEVQTADYWVGHLRNTVRFSDGLQELLKNQNHVLLEVGAGRTLSTIARQQETKPRIAISSLRAPQESLADRQTLLAALGRLWLEGVEADWDAIHSGARRRRVSLPTYPFERTRHWIEPGRPQSTDLSRELAKTEDISSWFYRPVWQRADPPTRPVLADKLRWLLFQDDAGLGKALAARLEELGQDVVVVKAGKKLSRDGDASFTIDPERRADYDRVFGELDAREKMPDRIVHMWSVSPKKRRGPTLESATRANTLGFQSLLYLAQALGKQGSQPAHIAALTSGAQQVAHESLSDPEKATLLGPCRVIPREYPNLSCQAIDVDLGDAVHGGISGAHGGLLADIIDEVAGPRADSTVAFRKGRRWRLLHEAAPIEADESVEARLRERGVYLITGGLGSVGLALAKQLAESYRARLVLVGRTPLAERSEQHSLSTLDAARLAAVEELRALGAEVLTIAADVGDEPSMRDAVKAAVDHFGAISGVFHAAGVLDDGPVQSKREEAAGAVLRPKVAGTLALETALRQTKPDFVVLFSSTSAILGVEGQVDYAAANCFLDAFAIHRSEKGGPPFISINWGIWSAGALRENREVEGPTAPSEIEGEPLEYPLLRRWRTEANGDIVASGSLSTADCWTLAGHRLAEGPAILPGSAYVDLACAAARLLGQQGAVEIHGLFFASSFAVHDKEERRIQVWIKRDGSSLNLEFRSALANLEQPSQLEEENAFASLRLVEADAPDRVDLQAIVDRCHVNEVATPDGAWVDRQERYIRFGPQWRSIRNIRYGQDEALALIQLPSEVGEPGAFRLHPALLDLASGFALDLIAGIEASEDLYIPMSYGRVTVWQDLPDRIVSHARLARPVTTNDNVVAFNVTITDELGNPIVDIEEFSVRRVPAEEFGALVAALGSASAKPELAGRPTVSPLVAIGETEGILAHEGMEALSRVLDRSSLPQIVVSSLPLDALQAFVSAAQDQAGEEAGALAERPGAAGTYEAPRDAIEEKLAGIWSPLLGVGQVGIDDDFFELGGHSLIAVRVFAQLQKEFSVELPLATVFTAPTIRRLAEVLRHDLNIDPPDEDGAADGRRPAMGADAWSCLVPIKPAGSRRPFFCVHGMNGNVLNLRDIASSLGDDQPFYGLQAYGLNGKDAPDIRIEDMAARYIEEIREVQQHGPYVLGGYSGGGLIAFEMAKQLFEQGQRVAPLIFIDTASPTYLNKNFWERMKGLVKGVGSRGLPFIRYWAYKKSVRIFQKLKGLNGRVDTESGSEPSVLDVGPHFLEAVASYDLQPNDSSILLFRAGYRGEDGYVPPELGWAGYAREGIEVIEIPGSHESMYVNPNVRLLAAGIRDCIDSVSEENVGATSASVQI